MSSTTIYGACPNTTIGPFHYLYRITNLVEQKHYYGIRTSRNILPQNDLGKKYFSSSHDKDFRKDQKEHPKNYRYKIIIISDSRQRVSDLEIKIHQKFNVGINPKFYNKSIQSSIGFDVSGMSTFKNKNGEFLHVSVDDPRVTTGELKGITTGMGVYIDKTGKYIQTSIDDTRISSGELKHLNTGTRRIYNQELRKNSLLKPDELLMEGWEYGLRHFNEKELGTVQGRKWIHNPLLKKNKLLKPNENLPEGWQYGWRGVDGKKLGIEKSSRRIFNPELKKTSWLKTGEDLPEGWEYGMMDFDSKRIGYKRIFNKELKQNRTLKPGEEIPEGWSYGMFKRSLVKE